MQSATSTATKFATFLAATARRRRVSKNARRSRSRWFVSFYVNGTKTKEGERTALKMLRSEKEAVHNTHFVRSPALR